MRQKRRCKYVGGPRMRPEDPANSDRIAAGVLRSMQLAGYDYPVRKLSRHSNQSRVTLPLQVRNLLALERGDWLVFGGTPWRGVAAFVSVSDEQYRTMTRDDLAAARLTARKVQGKKGGLFVSIPQAICEILSAEPGDFLHFSPRSEQSVVDVSAIKGGGESAGSRRSG